MNQHEEVWIDGREYDLVHVLHSTYWEVILVDVETDRIVGWLGTIDI
jgi:hypothetical protein